MSYNPRKRRNRPKERNYGHSYQVSPDNFESDWIDERDRGASDPTLFIQAHEANIIRGPQATAAAHSLEVFKYQSDDSDHRVLPQSYVGEALLRWGGQPNKVSGDFSALDEVINNDKVTEESQNVEEGKAIWIDRYDARLLLDALREAKRPEIVTTAPDSPGGWSDLPSDSEDTFFFSPDEADDFRRDKRRRIMNHDREERLKARMKEDEVVEPLEEPWGGSDEEVDETEKELMRRTASHIISSPNPAQLEMRILANHGNDKRFAFLRGRWSRAWKLIKGKARIEQEKKKQGEVGLGVLAAYGDSDGTDSEDDGEKEKPKVQEAVQENSPPTVIIEIGKDDELAVKEARRQRAKQWAEKRRAMKPDVDP